MGQTLRTILQNLFKIHPEEMRRTGLAFVYLFSAIGSFIVGRIARTVLFLEIPNYKEQLPLMYIGIAAAVSITMYAYARVERRLRRDLTNQITLVILIAGTLAFRFALNGGNHSVYWAFYIWTEIFGAFLVVQFWSFVGEIFHSRQAKRLFAVIGGGGVLANVAIGFGISGSVKALGTENLLYVICLCMVAAFVAVHFLGRDARTELQAAREKKVGGKSTAKPQGKVFATRHVQLIAIVVVLTYIVSTLADYQLQVIVGDSIPLKDERSAYFGSFFGITGILAGIIQFFFTSRLLERFGILVALLLLPSSMLLGSVGLLSVPLISGLWAVSFTKGSENVLRYTVNDSTLQLMYLPVPANLRGLAKAFIDGILKPLSIGGAGLALAVAVGQFEKLTGIPLGIKLDVYSLSWVVCITLVAWVVSLLGLRQEYLRSLLQTLQKRRLNFADASFEIKDEGTLQVLDKALASPRMGEILHGLELLPFVATKNRAQLDHHATKLLAHTAEEVRVATLKYLRSANTTSYGDEVRELLIDRDPDVRASAVLALCAIRHEKATAHVLEMLEDPSPRVRAATIAGLIRYAGLDGVLACADLLKNMLTSTHPNDREQAAWILGEVGVSNFYQPLVPLLEDTNEPVRRAAVLAAERLTCPELIPALFAQLERPGLRSVAVSALAAYGEQVVEPAANLLSNETKHPAVRAQAAKILGRIATSRAVEVLAKHLQDPQTLVRTRSVQSMAHIIHLSPGVRIDQKLVGACLRLEAQTYYDLLAVSVDLGLSDSGLLLHDALENKKAQAVQRVLALLSLKYDPKTIELVTRNLQSSQVAIRANAVEVLDNLLSSEEKALLIPILDDTPPERTLTAGAAVLTIRRLPREERLTELLRSTDTWLQATAAVAVGSWKLSRLQDEVLNLIQSTDPVCRETAVVALRQLEAKESLLRNLKKLSDDVVPAVSHYAQFVMASMEREATS